MIILITLIGAIILMDKYAIGEFGISQPIISGTIIGALCGDIKTGILIGSLFQLLFLANLPIGKDVPPDAQAGSIAGCGSYFIQKLIYQIEPNLMMVFLVGILGSILGNFFDVLVRRTNEQLYYLFLRDKRKLIIYHLLGILTSFFRGFILFLFIFSIISMIKFPPGIKGLNKEILVLIIIALGIANGIYLYLRKPAIYFFFAGVICALIFFIF
jgi:mannose/fructose/N-acetylgalactosamine-specific phosphotransferase system component IIC